MSGVFIEIRAMAGSNHVRADAVIGVQYVDPQRCTILMAGGALLPCAESAKQVVARLNAALQPESETTHGDGSS